MEGVTIITMGVGFGPSNGHVDVKDDLFFSFCSCFWYTFCMLRKDLNLFYKWQVVSSCLTKSVLQCCDWSPTISVSCCFFQALNDLNNEDLKAKLGLEDLSEGWECNVVVDPWMPEKSSPNPLWPGLQRVNGSSWLQLQIRRAISLVNLFF